MSSSAIVVLAEARLGGCFKGVVFAVADCSFFYPMGIFEGKEGSRSSSSIEDLISKAEYRVARWISMTKERGNIKLNDLIFNWVACMSWALEKEIGFLDSPATWRSQI